MCKVGEKLVCINNIFSESKKFTIDKQYTISWVNKYEIAIIDDSGTTRFFNNTDWSMFYIKNYFDNLKRYRKRKLMKLMSIYN